MSSLITSGADILFQQKSSDWNRPDVISTKLLHFPTARVVRFKEISEASKCLI